MQHSDCNTPTRCAHAVYNSFGIWPAYELVLKMPKKTLLHNLTSKFNFTPANQNGSAERLRIFDWFKNIYPGGEVSVVFFSDFEFCCRRNIVDDFRACRAGLFYITSHIMNEMQGLGRYFLVHLKNTHI